ncbi:MAG: dihydrolipoamide dehydrogenase [Candidatus Lokiarchaeota archaeon]|nr:dihydrolipoamide dehydrogenase [Candidatus Lokiarchaeota archaeon]
METYDLIVIGAGVGLNIINGALRRGLKVAVIEKGKVGGTCLTRGCIPSKILVYPADVIREAQHANKVGLDIKIQNVDWNMIAKRMWSQIDHSKQMKQGLKHTPNLRFFDGTAEFIAEYTLKVKQNNGGESKPFKGDKIVIASGARSLIPPIKGLEETGYITNESFFGDKFPKKPWKSLIIIGGGIIAAEFAHIFSAFGTDVTIIEMLPNLLNTEEPEISEFVEKEFKKHMTVLTNKKAIATSKEKGVKVVTVEDTESGKTSKVKGEEIFVATGRKSNTDLLKVEKSGIEMDKRGWIKINDYLETNKKNIWCIGDANGKYQFRHKANYEAEILENNLWAEKDGKHLIDYSTTPWAIYTWPQVAHVGMTEQEALDGEFKIYTAINHYSEVAKGFAMGYEEGADDDGFVKLIINRDRTILGAHIVGQFATVLIQQFVYLMNAGYACKLEPEKAMDQIPKPERACPTAGSFIPIYRSQVIHPSINEVAAWALGNIKPVNIEQQEHYHHHDH